MLLNSLISANTQKYPNEINEQKKKLSLSSFALLTITPVVKASCTEIAQKNNEDLVNSGNAGKGGGVAQCLPSTLWICGL